MIELQADNGSIWLVLRVSSKFIVIRSPKIVYARRIDNKHIDWNEGWSQVKTPFEIQWQINRFLTLKEYW